MPRSFDSVFYGAAGGGVDLPSDDQFNRVSFLSHFDGANNGVNNVFDDGSASNHTITANGNATQGSFGPFARPDGEWGWNFPADEDMLTVPTSTDLNLGTGDFTLECFIFVQNPEDNGGIMSKRDNQGGFNNSYRTSYRTGSKKVSFAMSTGSVEILSPVVEKGIWTHIAVVRNSGTLSIYAAGVQGGTATSNTADEGASWPFTIGSQYQESGASPQFSFIGLISNVRFVKGTAVYSGSSFTPPTSKLTAITNTKLLTCQSNRFVDNSASGHTITPAGSAAVTSFGPFLTSSVYKSAVNGGSAYFDGNVDRLHTPEDASTRVAASNFTFEAWVYPTTTTVVNDMIFTQGAPGVYSPFNVYILGTTVRIYISTNGTSWNIASNSTSSNSVQINAWNHIALVRNGTTIGLYINGVADNTYAVSTTAFFTPTRETSVGGRDGEEYFTGYITDARLVIGTAVYTSAFTPPTAPLTAVTNTKLLLSMKNGQAIDSAAQNNLTLYGTAKTSTAQKKFGTASLLLDGNSDYATFRENGGNDIDGGGNWTVEFFWRFVNKTSPSTQEIISKGAGFQLYTINGSLGFALSANNSGTYFINSPGGTTLDNDTWYHIALVKNGTSYKLYLNGTSDLSATSSSNIDTGGYPWFLGTISGAESTYPSNGYMDEVRISKFARYTSNFTAPTEPFADKGQ